MFIISQVIPLHTYHATTLPAIILDTLPRLRCSASLLLAQDLPRYFQKPLFSTANKRSTVTCQSKMTLPCMTFSRPLTLWSRRASPSCSLVMVVQGRHKSNLTEALFLAIT